MRIRHFVGWLAGAAVSALVTAQAPVMGPEFVVNAATQGYQREPAVASIGPNGDFLVIWNSFEEYTHTNLMGRRFSSEGVPLDATDFLVNSGPSSFNFLIRVASNDAGDFVVTWSDVTPEGVEVRARLFDASGAAVGNDILVNQYTTDDQMSSSVAMNPDGSFFVVWRSGGYYVADSQDGSGYGVFGRRFDADGQPLGDEFALHQYTTGKQDLPRIARKPDGNFIVVWRSGFDPWAGGGRNAIFAREFDAAGEATGDEFQVDTPSPLHAPLHLDVAVDGDGNAIVVWEDVEIFSLEFGVHAQRLDAFGNKLGPLFVVSDDPERAEARPGVAVGPYGFVVAWCGETPSAPPRPLIQAQQYDASGGRQGDAFTVNAEPLEVPYCPAIAAQSTGQFVVAWSSMRDDVSLEDVSARIMGVSRSRSDPILAPPRQRRPVRINRTP